jgi:cytochrome c biogenesis protein ResB
MLFFIFSTFSFITQQRESNKAAALGLSFARSFFTLRQLKTVFFSLHLLGLIVMMGENLHSCLLKERKIIK